jgi:DNA-binding transcriptional MerR regulator
MTIQELADRADVTTRTIRYYVEQGVLPPPERGRPAEYTEEHVARLALIKRLKAQYLPLEEIRDTMQRLSLPEVEALVADYSPQQEQTQKLDSAADYIANVLGRGIVREQMKQAATADEGRGTKDEVQQATELAQERAVAPGSPAPVDRPLREAPYEELSLVPAPELAHAPLSSQGAAGAPAPTAPAPGTAPQQSAPSLVSRLRSSVVGRRAAGERSSVVPRPSPVVSGGSATAWQRVQLGEGIELHYPASDDARFNEMVARLVEAAHRILDEGPGNGE